MSEAIPELSIIVPALNEAANIPELLRRLRDSLPGLNYEILLVDDNSTDETEAVCQGLKGEHPLRLIVRKHPKNGLSGAVLDGIALARGSTLLVMDADLQHPPEQAPRLLAELDRGADFVLGSRYLPGGTTGDKWTPYRRLNSWVATFLARPFSGRTTDPMSGFFALRRQTFLRGERLTPLGYKVGLELMCKCRVRAIREVPIDFATRLHGESKLNLRQQFRYLEHLSRLYDFFYPRASPIAKFVIVTALSWTIGLSCYSMFRSLSFSPLMAIVPAYAMFVLMTAAFHARYVRTQREFLTTATPWAEFWLTSAVEMMSAVLTVLWAGHRLVHPGSMETPVLAFAAATAVRYVLRKELMQDIRGLRREPRALELLPVAAPATAPSATEQAGRRDRILEADLPA